MAYCTRHCKGGCYYEFQRDNYDHGEPKHWQADSLFMHDDIFEHLKLYPIILQVLPHFNPYGPTVVNAQQWVEIKQLINTQGTPAAQATLLELSPWVDECLQTDDCFSILGP